MGLTVWLSRPSIRFSPAKTRPRTVSFSNRENSDATWATDHLGSSSSVRADTTSFLTSASFPERVCFSGMLYASVIADPTVDSTDCTKDLSTSGATHSITGLPTSLAKSSIA